MHSSRIRTVRCSGLFGGCLPGGCLPRGLYTSANGQTDTCENITFPQLLLRTVERRRVYYTLKVLEFVFEKWIEKRQD